MIGVVDAAHDSINAKAIQKYSNTGFLFPSEAYQTITATFLTNEGLVPILRKMTAGDQTKFLDKVDQAYPILHLYNEGHVNVLGDVCSKIRRLPTSAVLCNGLNKLNGVVSVSGSFADIWQGRRQGQRRGEIFQSPVAIKAFRRHDEKDLDKAKEILWKRVPVWRKLNHRNILPFRGANTTLFNLSLVYDWVRDGNITQYISSHPEAFRPSLLLDVADGLEYLHSLKIAHGNLKGANVVISPKGHACLTDYGLAPIKFDPSFTVAATKGAVGMARWLAPEIINSHTTDAMPVVESAAADVFAFGMLAVEVFSGKVPFEGQKDEAVVLHISQGGRPKMPERHLEVGLTHEMWVIIERCWQQNPEERPEIPEVVRHWRGFVVDDGSDGGPQGTSRRDRHGLGHRSAFCANS